ncbi:amine oxidase [Thozetella sp. PMI_491]|nr:amine oxidase [Thozetella sp. PMI_491]
MVYSRDGFTWTPSAGLREGLPTIGVIDPPTYVAPLAGDQPYDVVVIGAGYAGLVATRDLTTQGKRVLLLEGRDRLGGRTWHATINGFNYEMGGTWIHWHMPHVYREVSLYGLHNEWLVTQNPGGKEDYFTLTAGDKQWNLTHEEEVTIIGKVWEKFCDLDGNKLSQTWKYAFGTSQSPKLMAEWDKMSCRDRLEQIRDELSPKEIAVLEAFLYQMGGSSLERMGLLNALHWWILGSHKPTGLNDIALHTRLRCGNSELHRRIFEHAKSTGNLSYSFDSAVTQIQDDGMVTITTRDGATWKAKSVICTVPLNVLSSIQFNPPLSPGKQAAAAEGQVNLCNKVHIDLNGPDYLSWTSFSSPGKGLICAIGDRLTPADNSHLVAFGPDPAISNGIALKDIDAVKEGFLGLLPKAKRDEVILNRIVSHDWNNDEFAKGTWCYLPPNFLTSYLEELQKPHGNVFFASGDWSDGWRGWIDGACQAGMQAAHQVIQLQNQTLKSSPVTNGMTNGHVKGVEQVKINGITA